MSEQRDEQRDINMKATLSAVKERQERLSQIKEKNMKKLNQDAKISTGIQLLYNVMKHENIKILMDVNDVFKTNLPFNCDLQKEYIKPPYLVPKIVSHKFERHLNSMI